MPKTITIKEQVNDSTINIVLDTLEIKKQALVFCNSKRSAEKTAEDISLSVSKAIKLSQTNISIIFTDEEKKQLEELSQKILHTLSKPTKQCKRLADCVKKGIAYHHAGLVMEQKTLIEEAFRQNVVKIIAATPTLAFGLDLPAFRVVIKNLNRYGARGMQPIPVLEYHQMVGRAGRPGKTKWGEAITLAATEAGRQKITDEFIKADPEDIYSKLAVEPVLRFYLLSLIATDFVRTRKQIMDFFNKTFWAHQFGDIYELMRKIDKMLNLLIDYGFIESSRSRAEKLKGNKNIYGNKKSNQEISNTEITIEGDFLSADELYNELEEKEGDKLKTAEFIDKDGVHNTYRKYSADREYNIHHESEKYSATLLGKRVSELYIDPYTANQIISALKRTTAIHVLPISILQMLCITLELRPKLRLKTKEYDDITGKLIEVESNMIVLEPSQFDPEYEDYMDSFKTALFFHDWIEENDEEFLLEKYDIRPGEIKAKLDKADWLLYAAVELCNILRGDSKGIPSYIKDIIPKLNSIRFRMKYGVKEELLALLKLQNIGRVRARKLYGHGIKDLGDVKKTNIVTLAQIIGKKTAIDIKEQIGEKVRPEDIKIKENKRKGQISLKDFYMN
ncbi:MAG: helicase-related protein [Candidatus Woesearchaeota archaeon]